MAWPISWVALEVLVIAKLETIKRELSWPTLSYKYTKISECSGHFRKLNEIWPNESAACLGLFSRIRLRILCSLPGEPERGARPDVGAAVRVRVEQQGLGDVGDLHVERQERHHLLLTAVALRVHEQLGKGPRVRRGLQ